MSMMDPSMGGFAMQGPPPEETQEGPVEMLRASLDSIQQYMQAEGDDQFSKEAAKAAQILYGILSVLQKEGESAMGATPQTKFMARQQAAGGGAPAGY